MVTDYTKFLLNIKEFCFTERLPKLGHLEKSEAIRKFTEINQFNITEYKQ